MTGYLNYILPGLGMGSFKKGDQNLIQRFFPIHKMAQMNRMALLSHQILAMYGLKNTTAYFEGIRARHTDNGNGPCTRR